MKKFSSFKLYEILAKQGSKGHCIRLSFTDSGRINRMSLSGEVIELRCGLGDILSNLKVRDKEGYDIDAKVIKAAKWAHPFLKVHVGSFDEVHGKKISLLIAVNFLCSINDDILWACFNRLIFNNDIDRIVVDDVPCSPYKYAHDYIYYFNSVGYVLEFKSRGFEAVGGRRYLLFFKKRKPK